jgi:hypothetical protein
MNIELHPEERKAPSYTLELSAETYQELESNLGGIRTIANAIKAIIPPHMAERLEACITKSMGAIGMIAAMKEPPAYDTACDGELIEQEPTP